MRAAVVGYGSIGMRHARIMNRWTEHVAIVSRRNIDHPYRYTSIEELLSKENPDYLIVANNTSDHWSTLEVVAEMGFKGVVLVEKPLSDQVEKGKLGLAHCFVGYNLRFHPILQRLKKALQNETVVSAHIYAGQYLPQWRPNTDYRQGYSASKAKGGGVLRDLSHELDYMNWLLGKWEKVVSLGGKLTDLEIDSDDHYTLLLQQQHCPSVVVHLNYLDHVNQRRIIIHTNSTTYIADLINQTLQVNDKITQFQVQRDDTYIAMHQAILSGEYASVCTLEDAMVTMRLIEASEQSQLTGKWVYYD